QRILFCHRTLGWECFCGGRLTRSPGGNLGTAGRIDRAPAVSNGPPQISAKNKPLRRKVAMAYRTAREAGKAHDRAFDAAMTVYLEARPEEKTDQAAASEKVAVMISSAISVDPEWFWRNVKPGDYWRRD